MLIFFLSLMIPEMNTGSAEVSILTCNHKKMYIKLRMIQNEQLTGTGEPVLKQDLLFTLRTT